MNKTKRFSLGLLSSLLLAVGFVRAADHIDPMTSENKFNESTFTGLSAAGCAVPTILTNEQD